MRKIGVAMEAAMSMSAMSGMSAMASMTADMSPVPMMHARQMEMEYSAER
jgi:hypothetical protein